MTPPAPPAPETSWAGTRETVTLDVWRVRRRDVARVMAGTPRWNRRPRPEAPFRRLLGTGDTRFRPAAADLTRWAAVRTGTPAATPGFARAATGHFRATLVPLTAHGRWAGAAPFAPVAHARAATWRGEVLVVTRARLAPRQAVAFWRAVPPVAAGLHDAPGLLAAMGVGEAPLGYQGTLSLWRDAASMTEFAWRHPAHRAVLDRTPAARWYAEELFARFAVVDRTADLGLWADRTADRTADLTGSVG